MTCRPVWSTSSTAAKRSSRPSAIILAFARCRLSVRRRWRDSSINASRNAGKRVQALGGAKNFIVVMPDADFDRSIPVITESFYGCAGERCLAGSVLLPVGEAHKTTRELLIESAKALKVGDGLEPGVTMGPVISAKHRERVLGYVEQGIKEGAKTRAGRPAGHGEGSSRRAFSSARPCSTMCRRAWSSDTRRFSVPWPRCAE